MGFQVGEGGNVANAYGKGPALYSGETVTYAPKLTTKDGEGNFVSKGELAYLSALANVNAGVSGWGLGTLGPGNAYGMTPGLTGVPGKFAPANLTLGEAIALFGPIAVGIATGGLPGGALAVLSQVGQAAARGGTFGEGIANAANAYSGMIGGPQGGLVGSGLIGAAGGGIGSAVTGSASTPTLAQAIAESTPEEETEVAEGEPYDLGFPESPLLGGQRVFDAELARTISPENLAQYDLATQDVLIKYVADQLLQRAQTQGQLA
jgi:hypothetical protein